MVPFCGQSMNLGSYDCIVLSELVVNGKSAMYNFIENPVNTWSFALRGELLYRLLPKRWTPLQTMVTFSRIPVDECVWLRERQDMFLSRTWSLDPDDFLRKALE